MTLGEKRVMVTCGYNFQWGILKEIKLSTFQKKAAPFFIHTVNPLHYSTDGSESYAFSFALITLFY